MSNDVKNLQIKHLQVFFINIKNLPYSFLIVNCHLGGTGRLIGVASFIKLSASTLLDAI